MSAGPSGVPDVLSALSSGTVPVAVEPVHTAEQAAELDLMLWRIRGTRAVQLRGLQGGSATFDVGLRRPVAMASDLRALFGRDLLDCRRDGDVFRVRLAAPPATPDRTAAPAASVPLTGRWTAEPVAEPEPAPALVPEDPEPLAPGTAAAAARLEDPAALADAVDADPDVLVVLIDHELRIRAAYGGLRPPWGPREETVAGAALGDVAPPHLHRGLTDRVAAVLRGTTASHVYTSAGPGRVFEVALRPVRLDDRVAGCRATVRDVTDRHRERERIRDLTAVFEVAFREAPTGQALLGPDGTWLRTNDALHRLLGRAAEELQGTALAALLDEGEARRERAFRAEVDRGDRVRFAVDLDPRAAGLSTVGVRAHVAAITSPEGRVRAYVAHLAPTGELPVELDPEIVDGPW